MPFNNKVDHTSVEYWLTPQLEHGKYNVRLEIPPASESGEMLKVVNQRSEDTGADLKGLPVVKYNSIKKRSC